MPELPLIESYWPADTSVDVVELSVGDLLRQATSQTPDSIALVHADDPANRRTWTYAQLLEQAEQAARMLLKRFEPGDRVAIWAPNIPEWEVMQFGCALAGLTIVTVNPALRPNEIEYQLKQSRSAGLVMIPEYRGANLAASLEQVRDQLPELREVIDITSWQADGDPDAELPGVGAGDTAMILYTSGTTGFPKGAMLTHRGIVNNARLFARRFGIEKGSVWLGPLPMFHSGGSIFQALGAMWCNATHVITTFDPGTMLRLFEEEKVNFVPAVPTMCTAMMAHPDFATRDLSSLQTLMSGGTTVPPELIKQIEEKFQARYGMIFGQTENSGVIAQSFPDDTLIDKSERVGRVLEQTECKVIDPATGKVQPPGEVGEFCLRGFGKLAGYFEMPEQTAATIDDEGWMHTGDLGTMDERGYLQVTGRLKDMVIRGGENIYPREIEDVLFGHPDIAAIAVIGVPDDHWGERLVGIVQPPEGVTPDFAAIMERGFENLARHKVPREWASIDTLPLTAGGKIQKFALRDQYIAGELQTSTPQ